MTLEGDTPALIAVVSDSSRRKVLIAAALGSSLAPFMVSAFIVALPSIGREFSSGAAMLGWITSAFFLAAAVFLVPIGRLADRSGIKKIFTAGIGVYAFSALLVIFAPSVEALIAARFVTGIGAAMIFGTSIALVSLVFPESERGRAIGINVTAMAVGFLLGFFSGGFLTFYLGWRSIVAVLIPLEIFVIWLILSRLRGECEISRQREIDPAGMVLYGTSMFCLMAGFAILPGISGGALLGLGMACLIGFIWHEGRIKIPLLAVRQLAGNRLFVVANLIALLYNAANFAIIFLMSLYLQSVRGIDARVSGVILLIPIIFMAGLSAYAGRLADRIEPRIVTGSGVAATTLSLFFLTMLEKDTPMPLVLVALILMGSSIALFQSPLVRTLVSSVPREQYGLASGMVETMRLAGMTISISITVIIFTLTGTGAPAAGVSSPADIGSLHTIFWILLSISLCALVATFALRK
ncbi:MAG: MFS transporter [Methanoregula sp.]|jgi:MFS family permease